MLKLGYGDSVEAVTDADVLDTMIAGEFVDAGAAELEANETFAHPVKVGEVVKNPTAHPENDTEAVIVAFKAHSDYLYWKASQSPVQTAAQTAMFHVWSQVEEHAATISLHAIW